MTHLLLRRSVLLGAATAAPPEETNLYPRLHATLNASKNAEASLLVARAIASVRPGRAKGVA